MKDLLSGLMIVLIVLLEIAFVFGVYQGYDKDSGNSVIIALYGILFLPVSWLQVLAIRHLKEKSLYAYVFGVVGMTIWASPLLVAALFAIVVILLSQVGIN